MENPETLLAIKALIDYPHRDNVYGEEDMFRYIEAYVYTKLGLTVKYDKDMQDFYYEQALKIIEAGS